MAKRTTPEKRVKLLVCIIKKGDEIALTEACNEQCVALSFSGLGYGTAKSHYLSYLGLDEIEKRIVYSLIPNYCEARVLRAINKKLKLYLKWSITDKSCYLRFGNYLLRHEIEHKQMQGANILRDSAGFGHHKDIFIQQHLRCRQQIRDFNGHFCHLFNGIK